MHRQRDDGRRPPATQRARAARPAAEACPHTDTQDVTAAVREAICGALVAIYGQLHQRRGPAEALPFAPGGATGFDGHGVTYRPGVGLCVSCGDADGEPTYLPLRPWAPECDPDQQAEQPAGGHVLPAADAAAGGALTRVVPDLRTARGEKPAGLHPLYEALLHALFLINRPPESDGPEQPPSVRWPRYVRRVVEAVNAHPERPYSVADLADLAGVKVRTLQQGFRAHLGTSPMGYLRGVRLARAHDDLLRDDTLSIAEVAYCWGFTHLGRFAAAYAQRYGETPSRTRDRGSAA